MSQENLFGYDEQKSGKKEWLDMPEISPRR